MVCPEFSNPCFSFASDRAVKRVAFWKMAGLDYERDLSVQKGAGKIIIPGWVTKLVVLRHLCKIHAFSILWHTFVGSWRLATTRISRASRLVCGNERFDLLGAMAAWRSYCEVPQPKLFPASIVYIGTTAVSGTPSMPGMA